MSLRRFSHGMSSAFTMYCLVAYHCCVIAAFGRFKLEGEARFEPQELLQELYQLDRMVTSLQTGSSEG